MGLRLESAISVLRAGFEGYFDAGHTVIEHSRVRDCWTVVDRSGVMSCHHVRRYPGEKTYSKKAWEDFRAWIDGRVAAFKRLLELADRRVLFVRGEDPEDPDSTEGLLELADSIRRLGAAEIRIASICFGTTEKTEIAPGLGRFFIRPSWPAELPLQNVEWNRDYGFGPAWKGVDAEWDRVLKKV
jgi:hypothetical protein